MYPKNYFTTSIIFCYKMKDFLIKMLIWKKEKNKNVKVINSLSLLKDRLLCIGDSHKHEAHEHHESDIDESIAETYPDGSGYGFKR